MVGKKTNALTTRGKVWRMGIAIGVPMAIGIVSALLTISAADQYSGYEQPPLAPPGWLFPVAWTILYILMGIASYFIAAVIRDNKGKKGAENVKKTNLGRVALVIYGVQLAFNFVWSILFFNLNLYWVAFGWLIAMWLMILVLVIISFRLHKVAFWCLIPYLLWATFATYLNCGVALLN